MSDAQPRIVVVDDEQENLDLIERTLIDKYEVDCYTDPRKALEEFGRRPVSAVISDHMMPQMSGVEFLAKITALSPGSVRILVTGYADIAAALTAVNSGQVSAIIQKPIDAAFLRQHVDRCVTTYASFSAMKAQIEKMSQRNRELMEQIQTLDAVGSEKAKK